MKIIIPFFLIWLHVAAQFKPIRTTITQCYEKSWVFCKNSFEEDGTCCPWDGNHPNCRETEDVTCARSPDKRIYLSYECDNRNITANLTANTTQTFSQKNKEDKNCFTKIQVPEYTYTVESTIKIYIPRKKRNNNTQYFVYEGSREFSKPAFLNRTRNTKFIEYDAPVGSGAFVLFKAGRGRVREERIKVIVSGGPLSQW